MPGLYGIVSISQTSVPAAALSAALHCMRDRLHSKHDDFIDREYVDEHGQFAVGRVGPAAHDATGWPCGESKENNANLCFTAGAILSKDRLNRGIENYQHLPSELLKFKGFYSLFFFDKSRASAYVATDVRASTPVYYTSTEHFFYFAPEIGAIACMDGVNRTLDMSATANLLAGGFVLGGQTLVNEIRRLEGGHFMSCQESEPRKYFSFLPGSKKMPLHELREVMSAKLRQSVQNNINLDTSDKTIFFLSGGVDSRGILGAYRSVPHGGAQLSTVTWGTDGAIPRTDPQVAAEIARLAGTNHLFIRQAAANYEEHLRFYNRITEGLCEMPADHARQVPVMEKIYQQGYRISIRGDEVFGWGGPVRDYEWALRSVGVRRFSANPVFRKMVLPEHYEQMCNTSDAEIDRIICGYSNYSPNQAKDIAYFEHRLQNYLQGAINFRRYFFDDRNVWLDEDVLNLMQYVPDRLRIDKRFVTNVLKSMDSELWRYPLADVSLPQPMGEQASLERFLDGELADESSGVWEYFDRDEILKIYRAQCSVNRVNLGKKSTLDIKGQFKRVIIKHFPRKVRQYMTWLLPAAVPAPSKILNRLLVFKDWHDDYFS